jgi:hypothetical protein
VFDLAPLSTMRECFLVHPNVERLFLRARLTPRRSRGCNSGALNRQQLLVTSVHVTRADAERRASNANECNTNGSDRNASSAAPRSDEIVIEVERYRRRQRRRRQRSAVDDEDGGECVELTSASRLSFSQAQYARYVAAFLREARAASGDDDDDDGDCDDSNDKGRQMSPSATTAATKAAAATTLPPYLVVNAVCVPHSPTQSVALHASLVQPALSLSFTPVRSLTLLPCALTDALLQSAFIAATLDASMNAPSPTVAVLPSPFAPSTGFFTMDVGVAF